MRHLVLSFTLLLAVPAGASAGVLDEPPLLTCDSQVTFAPSAFDNPTGAETGDDAPARALRDMIAQRANGPAPLPASGWRALARTEDVVVFHHGDRASRRVVRVARSGNDWRAGGEGCLLRRAAPGFEVAEIGLIGRDEAPRRSARRLRVSVLTGSCSSTPPAERLKRVEVRETRRAVTLLALMEPEDVPPGTVCNAMLVSVPAKVKLERRLGRRAIKDASVYPAKVVAPAR